MINQLWAHSKPRPRLRPHPYSLRRGTSKSGKDGRIAPAIWTVRRAPGTSPHRGLLCLGPAVLPCILGKSGISVLKREGDGATPAGRHAIIGGYARADRLPLLARLNRLMRIRRDDGWCDDPGHPAYNRPVRLPFAASHERMWRRDRLYDICLVLDWNFVPRGRFRGSAIFLHLTDGEGGPTQGCIAVEPAVMRRLLAEWRGAVTIRILP